MRKGIGVVVITLFGMLWLTVSITPVLIVGTVVSLVLLVSLMAVQIASGTLGDKVEYVYPGGKITRLTDQQAINAGFCPSCGYFVGGSEWDDLSMAQNGMCYECLQELLDEMYGDDDDDIPNNWEY